MRNDENNKGSKRGERSLMALHLPCAMNYTSLLVGVFSAILPKKSGKGVLCSPFCMKEQIWRGRVSCPRSHGQVCE